MALTADQELREHQLRIEQMQTNIDKMRREMKADTIKIVISVVGLAIGAFAAGIAAATYFGHLHGP